MPIKQKLSVYWRQFRVTAHNHNLKLVYLWALCTSLGFGYMYYQQKQGKDFRSKQMPHPLTTPINFMHCYTVSRDDMLPNVKFSEKIAQWIKSLGLDQTVDNPKRRS